MPKAKYKQDVEDLIALWKPVLGLDTWQVYLFWKKKLPGQLAALIKVDLKYKQARMELSIDEAKRYDAVQLESTIVHELAHILTEPLVDPPSDDEKTREHFIEVVTTDVEQAIIRARNAGMAVCID
jgi:hypothetical protein